MRKIMHSCMLIAFIAIMLIPSRKAFASSDVFLSRISSNRTLKRTNDSSPYLKKDSATILVDASDILTVYKVPSDSKISYKSSDESVLTVKAGDEDNTCEYTGIATGTATITVKISEPLFLFVSNTTTLKYTVDVTPKAVSVSFKTKKVKLDTGESKLLRYTIRPSISAEVPIFESSDKNIVTVSAKGKVSAISKGTAYITARISNGNSDKIKIVVSDPTPKTDSSLKTGR